MCTFPAPIAGSAVLLAVSIGVTLSGPTFLLAQRGEPGQLPAGQGAPPRRV